MIKNFILTFVLLSGFSVAALGQTGSSDSTTTKPVVTDTVKAKSDTIPQSTQPRIVPKDTVKAGQKTGNITQKDNSSSATSEPQIIYYQSVDKRDDHWGRSRTKMKHRGHHREIHTLTGRNSHSGGFGALSFKSTELREESIVMAGLRGGWIINRTLGIGFEGYGIIPTASFDDIGTQNIMPIGGYGGMFLELIFFSNQVIHITFPVSGGAGWLGYYEDDSSNITSIDGDKVGEDVFWYVEPGVDLEVNIARNFRLAGGVSRRFVQDLVLPETTNEDFNTLSYFLTLKIGSF